MAQTLGLLYGLDKGQYKKKQNRWLFSIPSVCADDTTGVDSLPPLKSARPNLSFKEMEVKHLMEDVFYPAKPDWKPVTITLYDLSKSTNPVWQWIKLVYDSQGGNFYPAISSQTQNNNTFIRTCDLKMFDGCGCLQETWTFEDAWCNNINFQTLDMGMHDVMTCEITLRYARAYLA